MIFVGLPLSPGGTRHNTLSLIRLAASRKHDLTFAELRSSLLTRTRNAFLATALNARKTQGVTHMVQIDADVVPEDGWLDIMLDEMTRTGAQVLSAVVALKDDTARTSTAREGAHIFDPVHFTWSEVAAMPETFTRPDLLLCTGLIVFDLTAPWIENVVFGMNDALGQTDEGRWRALVEPEDYHMSRQIRALGGCVWATRKVRAKYWGERAWAAP